MQAVSEQETLETQNTPTEISQEKSEQEKFKEMIASSEILSEIIHPNEYYTIPDNLYGVPIQKYLSENDNWKDLSVSYKYEINYKNGAVRDKLTKRDLKIHICKRVSENAFWGPMYSTGKKYYTIHGKIYTIGQLLYYNYLYPTNSSNPSNIWEVLKIDHDYEINREEKQIFSRKTGKLLKGIKGEFKYRIKSKIYHIDDLIKLQDEVEVE
jgi:hypothetical protein